MQAIRCLLKRTQNCHRSVSAIVFLAGTVRSLRTVPATGRALFRKRVSAKTGFAAVRSGCVRSSVRIVYFLGSYLKDKATRAR